ncbi:ABC transporter permease [Clostridium sp. DL1XJH146]
MKTSIIKNKKLFSIYVLIVILILWQITALGVDKEILIPTPRATFGSLIKIIQSKNFIIIVFSTLKRTFISFFLSLFFALIFGTLSGLFKNLFHIIEPIISIIRSTPTMAIIILALIWLGGERAPVLIGFIVVFPILYSSVYRGIVQTDEKLIQMAESYDVKKIVILKDIYIPSIKSYLLAGINAALGLCFKVMISAEVLGQPKYAMGTSLYMQKINLDMAGVFAWSIILIVIAVIFDKLVSLFFKQ